MALSQSDLQRLLESLRSTDGIELIRRVVEHMLQEATAYIGAEWNEHTASRTALRIGHRDKTLTTLAGDLDLEIPKVRTGSFFPSLIDQAPDRSGPLCRHHGGICARRLHPQRR